MNFTDILLAAGILVAAGWLFYKSFIREKGGCAECSGCTAHSCNEKNDSGKDRSIRLSGNNKQLNGLCRNEKGG